MSTVADLAPARSSQVEILNPVDHHLIRIDPVAARASFETVHLAPVMLSEFARAATRFPIVIVKNAETGEFGCSALFGFDENENLFFADAEHGYLPLSIARHPFSLRSTDPARTPSLCIDRANLGVGSAVGERLFADDGAPTALLERYQTMLNALLAGTAAIKTFIDQLLAARLIMPMSLDIMFDNGTVTLVRGLYTVDETQLAKLGPVDLGRLHHDGHLLAIHALVISLGQIEAMIGRRNRQNALERQWLRPGV